MFSERPAGSGARVVGAALGLLFARGALADEVIQDPELTGKPAPEAAPGTAPAPPDVKTAPAEAPGAAAEPAPALAAPPTAPAPPATGEQTVHDPELETKAHGTAPVSAPASGSGETTFRVVLGTRFGVDTAWERASEDVFEGTTIALVEARHQKSESLFYSVGIRARHAYGFRKNGDDRYELDAVPVSGYVDGAIGGSAHLRGGYQIVSLGRFDLFSATNFLGVYDLRSGPVTMPDAAEIAQPALRLDWDASSALMIQAFYLPFFQPDILPVYGTDYALLSSVDRAADRDATARAARGQLEDWFGRSAIATASTRALSAFAPEPSLTHPQGAVRTTLHGTAGELSVTAGTALERLPTFLSWTETTATGATPRFALEHDRFYVASTDAATDAGPFQIGAEAAFLAHRTLGTTATAPATPATARPEPPHANLLHGGVRAEFTGSDELLAEVEAFAEYALNAPEGTNAGWYGFEKGRLLRGVAAGVHYVPEGLPLQFELGGVVFSGPTWVVMPRIQWEALPAFYVEAGLVVIEGPAPNLASPFLPAPGAGASSVSLGGIYDDVDQAFVGARWLL